MTVHCVVRDDTALLALGAGNRNASRLVVTAKAAPGRVLMVPTLCVTAADVARAGVGEYVAALPTMGTEDLALDGALAVSALVRAGFTQAHAHALHAARPTFDRPDGSVIATLTPEAYEKAKARTWTSPRELSRRPD